MMMSLSMQLSCRSYRAGLHSNREELIRSASLKYPYARNGSATRAGFEQLFILCYFFDMTLRNRKAIIRSDSLKYLDAPTRSVTTAGPEN
eukprot:6758193-Pyramimonas_sp.AAC.2